MIAGLNGRVAVIIFLLLSGYLITQSIRLNIARNGCFNFTEYTIARVARIYPPFIGAILLCALVGTIITTFNLPGGSIPYGVPGDVFRVRDHFSLPSQEVLTGLLMIRGLTNADGPLWTLFLEFQMYIASIGIAIWLGETPKFRPGLLLLSISAFALALLQPTFALVWIIGALTNLVPLNRKVATIGAVVLSVLVAMAASYRPDWITAVDSPEAKNIQVLIGAILSYALILNWSKLDYPRWLIATGRFSYSVYVIHWPLLLLTLSLAQSWMGRSLFRTSLVAIFAGCAVILISMGFSAVFERQDFYRQRLKAIFPSKAGSHPLPSRLSTADREP